MEEKLTMLHKLSLEQREKLTMTGATEVIHFDEEMARLCTDGGTVCVYGSGLKLKTLSLEGGKVAIQGKIDAIVYEGDRKSGRWGWLQK